MLLQGAIIAAHCSDWASTHLEANHILSIHLNEVMLSEQAIPGRGKHYGFRNWLRIIIYTNIIYCELYEDQDPRASMTPIFDAFKCRVVYSEVLDCGMPHLAADVSLAIWVIFPSLYTNPTCPVLSFWRTIVLSNGLQKGERNKLVML